MKKIDTEQILTKVCKLAAIKQFDESLRLAGGGGYETFKHMTVEKFIDIVSHNGIRVSFSAEWHMNRVNPSISVFTEAVNAILEESK